MTGQKVTPNEASSSPNQIIAPRGSSVWLHWAYNYNKDGGHHRVTPGSVRYKEQLIGFKSKSQPNVQVLAKKIGQNGVLTLEPSIPAPFNGRVDVIPSNSTVVIHRLQYNDSLYQFVSKIIVEITVNSNTDLKVHDLQPEINVITTGTSIGRVLQLWLNI